MSADPLTDRLSAAFAMRFPGEPPSVLGRAPGRVNLIGEHTDYNHGFVLPIAIERETQALVRPRRDGRYRFHALDFGSDHEFSVERCEPDSSQGWTAYVCGVVGLLAEAGIPTPGADVVVGGTVPIGSGLSSSASLETAVGIALAGERMSRIALAKLGQQVEWRFAGVRCGIMDQFISCLGRRGTALLLDCASLEHQWIPFDDSGVALVITDSRQSRELAASAYNTRRAECEAAVAHFQGSLPYVASLRDISIADLEAHADGLDPAALRRARHVVTENARVLEACRHLRAGDMVGLGGVMRRAHVSLRDDYEVSSPAIEALITAANSGAECLGTRLTGAGFGGCTVSLVRRGAVPRFQAHVAATFEREVGVCPHFYASSPAEGASHRAVPPWGAVPR